MSTPFNNTKRARAAACKLCRTRKRRCIPSNSSESCRLCEQNSTKCSLVIEERRDNKQSRQVHQDFHDDPVSRVDDIRVDLVLLYEVVDLYFRYVHNLAHTMFHIPTFRKRLKSGAVPDYLLFAMASLSARFSTHPVFGASDPRSRGAYFASETMAALSKRITSPCLETAQACIILGCYFGGQEDKKSKHIYCGLGRLHAESLRVWDPLDRQSEIEKEEARRTWLSVCITNQWSAADMFLDFQPRAAQIALPRHGDTEFSEQDIYEDTVSLPEHTIWAQMAKTVDTYLKITLILRRLSRNRTMDDLDAAEMATLERELNDWANSLPPRLVYNHDNASYFSSKGIGRTFLAMHIGHFHFRQMLYYPYLNHPSLQEVDERELESPTIRRFADLCKFNATAVSDVISVSSRMKDCDLLYFVHGHIAVISSCIHLHTLLFGEESSTARQLLVGNFEYLLQLKLHWPVVDSSLNRLRDFQNECQRYKSHAFILDDWMLRFLVQHTVSLDERPQNEGGTSPAETFAPADSGRTMVSGVITPVDGLPNMKRPSISQLQGSGTSWEQEPLRSLLDEQEMTNEMLVESALNWLLND